MSDKKVYRVRWSKREKDVSVSWPAVPNGKSNGGFILGHLCMAETMFGPTFIEELKARGFDVTTLKMSIEWKPPEEKH